MPTPPPSAGSARRRDSSPTKRRRLEDEIPDHDGDLDTTPRSRHSDAGRSLALRNPPPARLWSPSLSSASGASQPSRRSTSPVKTAALDRLEKPVRFPQLAENAQEQLPAEIRPLYKSISRLAERRGLLPIEIRRDICVAVGRHLPSHYFARRQSRDDIHTSSRTPPSRGAGGAAGRRTDPAAPSAIKTAQLETQEREDGQSEVEAQLREQGEKTSANGAEQAQAPEAADSDYDSDGDDALLPPYEAERQRRQISISCRAALLAELDALVDVIRVADDCRRLGRHEAAWNTLVHGPLLQLALGRDRQAARVAVEPVTGVSISAPFMPAWRSAAGSREAAGVNSASKRVDFALVLRPAPALATAVRAAVDGQPPGKDTVNQSTYAALQYSPVAVSIETKTASGSAEEGRTQLAVWAAAWHQRMHDFLRCLPSPPSVVPLPLLLIVEHEWRLSFAVDQGDAIAGLPFASSCPLPPSPLTNLVQSVSCANTESSHCCRTSSQTCSSATPEVSSDCIPFWAFCESLPVGSRAHTRRGSKRYLRRIVCRSKDENSN